MDSVSEFGISTIVRMGTIRISPRAVSLFRWMADKHFLHIFYGEWVCDISGGWIQDFSWGGGDNSQSGCILQIFATNCMKMKEFGLSRGRAPLDLTMVISHVALAYNLLIKQCHSSNALKFTKSYLLWSRKLLCNKIQNQHIPLNSLANSCLIHLKLISTIESILICCIYLLHKYLQLKQFATGNLFCVVRWDW